MKKTVKLPTPQQLPSGQWYCRLRCYGVDEYVYGRSAKDAQQKAMTRKMNLQQEKKRSGAAPKKRSLSANMTVGEAVDAYIEQRRLSLSPSTLREYKGMRRNRFKELMELRIDDLTDELVQDHIEEESELVSAKSIYNAWGLLRPAIKYASKRSFEVHLPTVVRNEHEFLDHDEIDRFVEAVRGDPYEIPLLMALHSLRRSEIKAVTWDDIDLQHRRFHVRGAAVYDENYKLVFKEENKNDTSQRWIPFLIPELEEALLAVPKEKRTGLVVPQSPHRIFLAVNRVCKSIDLPEVGTHGLRHSFCSLCYYLEIPANTTMRLGGWKDIGTVNKIYTHISDRTLGEAAAAIAEFYSTRTSRTAKTQN